MKTQWKISDISKADYIGEIEFEAGGETHHFHIVATPERIVFGGTCNVGLLESGYLPREEGESIDEGLRELMEDLEVYYNDGPAYTSRIVCNERMGGRE